MKIILIIIGSMIGIILCLLFVCLFAKIHIKGQGIISDIKKEGKVSVSFLFKLIKASLTIQLIAENDLQGDITISILGFTIKKNIRSLFWETKVKSMVTDVPKEKTVSSKAEKEDVEQKKKQDYFSKGLGFIKTGKQLHTILKEFLHTVVIEQLRIQLKYGIGDAAATGISAGILWSSYSIFLGIIQTYFQLMCIPDVRFEPDFEGIRLDGSSECVISIRPIFAIFYGLKIFFVIRKQQKGQEQTTNSSF